MIDAVEYQKVKRRMAKGCRASSCNECPLSSDNNNENVYCADFEQNYTEKAVAIVERWGKDHPVKTYKSLFLEIFPNVKTTREGHPDFCLKRLCGAKGDDDICSCDITCEECWNQEYKK